VVSEVSYTLPLEQKAEEEAVTTKADVKKREQPVLQGFETPTQAAPKPTESKKAVVTEKSPSLFDAIGNWFSSLFGEEEQPKKAEPKKHNNRKRNNQRDGKNKQRQGRNKTNNRNNENRDSRDERRPNNRKDADRKQQNRKPERNNKNDKLNANEQPAQQKVAERRQRRDNRKSVRNKAPVDVVETKNVVEAPEQEIKKPVAATKEKDANGNTEANESRTRSRRSPRHARAAGQKRRKNDSSEAQEENKNIQAVELQDKNIEPQEAEAKKDTVVESTSRVDTKNTNVDETVTTLKVEEKLVKLEETSQKEKSVPQQVEIDLSVAPDSDSEQELVTSEKTDLPIEVDNSVKEPIKAEKEVVVSEKPKKVRQHFSARSVSAPMAKPIEITDAFVDYAIAAVDEESRPAHKAGNAAAMLNASTGAQAPAGRPTSL
jgi:ribonuclease E